MTRRIACVVVLLTLIFALSQAYANGQAPGGWGHPHMWGHGGGWGWMIFGPLMMIVVIAVIVALVVLLVRWLGGGARPTDLAPPGKAPLDILKARFAHGEIDKEEYEERRRLLSD
jgi:putative membrane protein